MATQQHVVTAERAGVVSSIDNRRLARIAKLAGAPQDPAAGLELHAPLGTEVAKGQPLYTIHAHSRGGLQYGLEFAQSQNDVLTIGAAS
jgi:thymidine phosphorylase